MGNSGRLRVGVIGVGKMAEQHAKNLARFAARAVLGLACLAAGKPTPCAKPLASAPEDALRVLAAEVEVGRRLIAMGFDSARWLLGEEVLEVTVRGLRSRDELPAASTDLLLLQMVMSHDGLATAEIYMIVLIEKPSLYVA